jgi:exopolysaccharide biosynthesis polyprenyl glycosylphosphotransferase
MASFPSAARRGRKRDGELRIGKWSSVFRRFSIDFALFSIFADGCLVAINLVLASALRPLLNGLPLVNTYFGVQQVPPLLYLLFPVIWIFCLLLFSVYHPSRNLYFGDELVNLFLGSMLAGVSLAGVLYLSYRDISRIFFLSFFLTTLVLMVGWRLLAQAAFHWSGHRLLPFRRVLIIGAGIVGKNLQRKIEEHRDVRLKLVGFLDDDPKKQAEDPLVLDTLENVRRAVMTRQVDHIILALPLRAHEQVNRLVANLHDLPVKVYVIPDYFALSLHHAAIDEFAGIPLLDLRAPALSDYQRLTKRAFDIAVTLLLLPITLPLMGLVALAVRIDSSGPVLFIQQRAGENGKLFGMYKFRTMVENADDMLHLVEQVNPEGNIIHKTAFDPRVTRLGGFLRRTSMDELPQFFNVLRGEMSLVGPRPEMPCLVERYEPWQRKRFVVPPGLTGYWQVHGRSDKPMHLHTEEDLYYIQHYSPWLDIVILFQTVGAILSRKGAY